MKDEYFLLSIAIWTIALILLCIFLAYFLCLTLEDFSHLSEMIVALSAIAVVLTYIHEKNKTSATSIAEQIHMFRDEIIPLAETLSSKILEVDKDYQFPEIKNIAEFDFKWFAEHDIENATLQNQLLMKLEARYGKNWQQEILNLLNALEELAIKINLTGTTHSSYLTSIKKGFIHIVEIYAQALMLLKNYNEMMYPGIRKIYKQWHKEVSRLTSKEVQNRFSQEMRSLRKNKGE